MEWVQWQADLVGHLRTLADGGFVNTSGPAIEVEGRGVLGRLQGRRPWSPVVTVLRMEDHLRVDTCVPSRHEPDWLDAARERLRATGWERQPEHVPASEELVRYEPLARTEVVADLAARTLVALGVRDPSVVEVEVVARG